MPELPEVETVVRDLRAVLPGMEFRDLDFEYAKALLPGADDFYNLRGLKVEKVERRGKFILILMERDFVITIHLRMTGRLIVQGHEDELLPYERVRLDFDGCSLRFCDLRRFGRVWLSKIEDYEQETGIWKLGVEPLSEEFDLGKFKELLKGKKGVLKKWLLDQSLIAGIGNIYADEACFYAEVRPDSEVSKLGEKELEALHKSVIRALEQGIRNRGTSVSDYADAYGKSGKNQELLYVYGRGGQNCLRCEATLKKVKLAGRGTVYCESCQSLCRPSA